MDIPRPKWVKLGVFLHPEMRPILEECAQQDGVSATIFVEKLLLREMAHKLPRKLLATVSAGIRSTVANRYGKKRKAA